MNDKNTALFFDEDNEYTVTITLTDEDGQEFDAEVITSMEIEELEKEFVAVLPTETPSDMDPGEVIILEYSEDEEGDPVFSPIEDEELFEMVTDAFNDFFADATLELTAPDEEMEVDGDDYLNRLDGSLPEGVSVKNK